MRTNVETCRNVVSLQHCVKYDNLSQRKWRMDTESLQADEHPATISTDYRQLIRLCQHRALVSLSIGTVRFVDCRRTTP